ncbi:cupin domain-containing protein [Streptomyces johnsoniae]|uniref:Cupin 2 conserved barrel domain-containing protein n=1 Tax=Streptomyces johnsoniae TaxID=3075532 RepID=A0ABU2SA56_9ACTN|nr:hypothetical protein [Streptomyces sp. DSM 41886]MDT0445825.1 hypothetical protein [Streptomyces sp. DSM 41886]
MQTPDVLARVAELLREAPVDQDGALWRLGPADRQLDANVVRLAPLAGIAGHIERDLDVLLFVIEGAGHLETDAGDLDLVPGTITWLPRGSRRALSAGPAGLVHLTVHRRRPALAVRGTAAEQEGGEAACLLHRVCTECGRLAGERDARYCGRCGTLLPEAA